MFYDQENTSVVFIKVAIPVMESITPMGYSIERHHGL